MKRNVFIFGFAMLLSVAGAFAQTTYIITGGGSSYKVNNGSATYSNPQAAVDYIRLAAEGADCTIQFETGNNTLDIGPFNHITFGNSGLLSWGTITLTGKLTASYYNVLNGVITMENNVSLNSKAEITNTTAHGKGIANYSSGAVTISGGTISITIGTAVHNNGTLNITGGTVLASNGTTVHNNGTLNISGGTVSATGDNGEVVHSGTVNISGGTVSATGTNGKAVSEGTVNISGGTVSATGTNGKAVYKSYGGGVNITGGIVQAIGEDGLAVYNTSSTETVTLTDNAIVFSCGTATTDVILGPYTQTVDAVIVAWNKAAGTTYYETGTSNDIFKKPTDATAVWERQNSNSGIAVNYNTTTGFIPIDGVTITGVEEVISITISPKTVTVQQGETQQFTATVIADGGADESVMWNVLGNVSGATTITDTGLLTVGSNEVAETIKVRATSVFDPTIYDEATVTIIVPKIVSVTISPKTATVKLGETQQFITTVNAIGGADESVTWNVSGNSSSSTTVSNTGLLTVGNDETAEIITVKVVSVFDPTVYDEATVAIGNVGIVETWHAASLQIYPNPVKDLLTIESEDANLAAKVVKIYDLLGKEVLESNLSDGKVDVSPLSPGGYILRIGGYAVRFVKE